MPFGETLSKEETQRKRKDSEGVAEKDKQRSAFIVLLLLTVCMLSMSDENMQWAVSSFGSEGLLKLIVVKLFDIL